MRRRSIATVAATAALAVAAVPALAAPAFTAEGTGAERVCYPAAHWAPAPDSLRPCVTVARLFEDGSGRLILSAAGGTGRAVCLMPNPGEERGGFALRCHRTPPR